MTCNKCMNDTLIVTKTTFYTNLKNCKVIIENVPCFKCSKCGHELFSAVVMDKIENLLDTIQDVFAVCVIDYTQMA